MAQRDDITVRWDLSPRLISIAAPSVELTIQDLHDTLREIEQRVENMIYPSIISTAGGEFLGGSTVVGLTATLENACVSFEARTASVADGYVTAIDITGTILTDSSALYITDGVQRGAGIINFDDFSVATVIQVISQTQLEVEILDDGITNMWSISPGDYYKIWNQVSVTITGGNLVAVDDIGGNINPVCPTMFVQVSRTTASSATSTFSQDIEFASFEGAVHVDISNITGRSSSGTTFPSGTSRQPVNNLPDALLIASERGFSKIFVHGDATIDSGLDYDGLTFEGESISRTNIVITSAASVFRCEFEKMSVSGVLDGYSTINKCIVEDLNFFDGFIIDSGIIGIITLGGGRQANFVNCYSGVAGGALGQTPEINCGGSGQALVVRGYSGGLNITNRTGTDAISIDMLSGQIIIDPTVTAGEITIRGIAKLTNNSTGTATVRRIDLVEGRNVVVGAYGGHISIDTENGFVGTEVGFNGLPTRPVTNMADAVSISTELSLPHLSVSGRLIFDRILTGYTFIADGRTSIGFDGYEAPGATFKELALTGILGTTTSLSILNNYRGFRCTLANVDNLSGTFSESILLGKVTCHPTAPLLLDGLRSDEKTYLSSTFEIPPIPTDPPTIDVNGGNLTVQGLDGYLLLTNVNDIDSYAVVSMNAGHVIIDPSCTNGTIIIRGNGQVTDASGGSSVNTIGNLSVNSISASTFNKLFPFTAGAQ